MWIRNTLAVLAGLAMAITLITLGVTADKAWFNELENINLNQKGDVFIYWQSVLTQAPDNFFIALLLSCIVGALIGGTVTAFLVKYARQAYAVLTGMVLFFMAFLDVIFFAHHPIWYKIALFFVFFPFAWLGGKLVEVLIQKNILPE